MNKKIAYLLVALVLPILIFVFLKLFGKNQFDIPVYYADGATIPSACSPATKGQYYLPDSLLKMVGWQGGAILFAEGTDEELNELRRLDDYSHKLQIAVLDRLKSDQQAIVKKCVLFLKNPYHAVLIDDQKRIRGYYALNSREELDRLDVELKILFKKY